MKKEPANSPVIIVIICVVVAVLAIAGVVALQYSVQKALKPSEIALSGTVTTTGTGTSPEKITFTSEKTGNPYVANANDGSYSISLPNSDTYRVSITWKFLGVTGGTADAGTLNLDSWATTLTKNWAG